MANPYSIAILLPTRARTDSLSASVTSLVNNCNDVSRIQILLAIDNDDTVGLEHFESSIRPFLDDQQVDYEVLAFDSMGYEGLNRYYNHLARQASADWLFVWNDDATMDTRDWDQVIQRHDGQFKILKVHTHNEHPYSIFPIVPKIWFDVLGVLSRHQMIDAEISQNAYMLDIIEIVDINVTHDQSELTGKQDTTSQQKNRFEGRPDDPRDFQFMQTVLTRINDCKILANYMSSLNLDVTFFKNIQDNKQDPWEKLKLNDINQQMYQWSRKV